MNHNKMDVPNGFEQTRMSDLKKELFIPGVSISSVSMAQTHSLDERVQPRFFTAPRIKLGEVLPPLARR